MIDKAKITIETSEKGLYGLLIKLWWWAFIRSALRGGWYARWICSINKDDPAP